MLIRGVQELRLDHALEAEEGRVVHRPSPSCRHAPGHWMFQKTNKGSTLQSSPSCPVLLVGKEELGRFVARMLSPGCSKVGELVEFSPSLVHLQLTTSSSCLRWESEHSREMSIPKLAQVWSVL